MTPRSYFDADPPETCKTCGHYHVYKNGQCYECHSADESAHADQLREERRINERTYKESSNGM